MENDISGKWRKTGKKWGDIMYKRYYFCRRWKKIERARKEGKYAQGTLVELLYQNRKPEGKTVNRLYSGIYEYTVEGITRTKRVVVPGNAPPKTLYFYYKKTPDHVFTEYDIGKNPFKILIYIIPVLVAFAVMTALGFRPWQIFRWGYWGVNMS